ESTIGQLAGCVSAQARILLGDAAQASSTDYVDRRGLPVCQVPCVLGRRRLRYRGLSQRLAISARFRPCYVTALLLAFRSLLQLHAGRNVILGADGAARAVVSRRCLR